MSTVLPDELLDELPLGLPLLVLLLQPAAGSRQGDRSQGSDRSGTSQWSFLSLI